jgi:hypothetical protein
MHRDAGDIESAREYGNSLLEVSPGDPSARALAAELGAGPTR